MMIFYKTLNRCHYELKVAVFRNIDVIIKYSNKSMICSDDEHTCQRMACFFADNYGKSIVVPCLDIAQWHNDKSLIYTQKIKQYPHLAQKKYECVLQDESRPLYNTPLKSPYFFVRHFFDINANKIPRNKAYMSGGFFLLDQYEDDTVYTAMGSLFGLLICKNITYSFPTIERYTFLQLQDEKIINRPMSYKDFAIKINGNLLIEKERFVRLTPRQNIFTTATLSNELDLVLSEGKVLHISLTGKTPIPINGYVVRVSRTYKDKIRVGDVVNLSLKAECKNIVFAIQAGPGLLHNENIIFNATSLYKENFIYKNNGLGLVPLYFDKSYLTGCSKNKTAFGINNRGEYIWIGVQAKKNGKTSAFTLAHEMKKLEAVHAIALDGGGSARCYNHDGQFFGTEGEKRALPYYLEIGCEQ